MVGVLDQARLLVTSPSRTPLAYGLLSVAQTPPDSDVHSMGGVRFETDPCGPANITTEACLATGGPQKAETEAWTTRASTPFTVYTMPICGTVGSYEEYTRRATAALTNGEARAVEREFESGEFGTIPHLAEDTAVTGSGFDNQIVVQTAATVVVSGAPKLSVALGYLERALAQCYGNEGVIHVPQQVLAASMANGTMFQKDGNRLRSPAGHLVAAGAGYQGLSPAGAATPTMQPYIYATGAVFVRRGEVQVFEPRTAVDRAKNDVYMLAERTYVLGWDCCHFAVQTDLTL